MKLIKDLLAKTHMLPERLRYHPEKFLYRHIAMVVLRSQVFTNSIDLQLAAIFHDLLKPSEGEMVAMDGDMKFWRNLNHGRQAEYFICDNDDIRYFIHTLGGDVDKIGNICHYHMEAKLGKMPKKVMDPDMMRIFNKLDDMIDRDGYKFIGLMPWLYGGSEITFIGMSPIQIHHGLNQFTITVDRTPMVHNFTEICDLITGDLGELFVI